MVYMGERPFWLLYYSMTRAAGAAFNTRFKLAVNNLFETSVIDDVIAERDSNMMQFMQQTNKLPTKYTKALWSKALRCDIVYADMYLNEFFGGLPE